MRRWWILLSVVACVASPSLAATDIPSKPGKSWKHKATGAEFPDSLAGLTRQKVVYFSAPEVDVAADYWSADGNDTITVYLYRDATGSVPLWFDRSRHFIMNLPEKYGEVKPSGTRPFVPRGQSLATGLIESFEVGKGARSSALAVLPFNGFYAKVRASSKTRDRAGLEDLLLSALNTFDWSSKGVPAAAFPVEDCAAPLPAREPAELFESTAEDRMMSGILGGLIGTVAAKEDKKDKPQASTVFCREPKQSNLNFGMYRRLGQDDGYFLAVLDGGRGINVGRNELAELVAASADKSGKAPASARFTVSFAQLDKIETYGDFTALPLPEQVMAMVESTRPVSIAGTWGKKEREVTIVTD